MPLSRLRLIADQFVLATAENDPGAAVFETGTVQGVSGIVLRKTRIKDLSVKTLHLNNECVTVPVADTVTSNWGAPYGSYATFLSQSITTKGVAGQPIYVLLLFSGAATLNDEFGAVSGRCFVNGSQVFTGWIIESNGGSPARRYSEPQRADMAVITATGSTQTITVEWQAFGSGYINAGSMAMAIAMKR
jgi:hypothetical protein